MMVWFFTREMYRWFDFASSGEVCLEWFLGTCWLRWFDFGSSGDVLLRLFGFGHSGGV